MTTVFLDIETTNLDKGSALNPDNRVLMVCWSVDGKRVKKASSLLDEEFLIDVSIAGKIVAYNAKFEMLWMLRHDYDITQWEWHDPMLAEKVLEANTPTRYGLGYVAEKYGYQAKDAVIDIMMKRGVCPSEMPKRRLAARCGRDVRTTQQLHERLQADLAIGDQEHLYRQRCDWAVFLAEVESEGMLLDAERVEAKYREYSLKLRELTVQLDEMTGGINLRSTDQVAEYLYETLGFPEKQQKGKPLRNKPSKRWPDGKPKTDSATMAWLEKQAETEEQKAFIALRREYGKINAAISKSLEFFKFVCDERDGKFHAQFNQAVAATDRLTSSGIPITFSDGKTRSVQFQNMAGEFKELFKAPEGYVIVEADAPQLEFRVGVGLGRDKQGMADIIDPDFDAHCVSASVMNQIPYEEFLAKHKSGDPEYAAMRKKAKPHTFKPFYGGTKGTEEEERWYKEFKNRYQGVAETQEAWINEVADKGMLRMPWGKTFFWDGEMDRWGVLRDRKTRRPLGPQICNYPIQNLATAEIMPIAIMALRARCSDIDVKFVNSIHDSVIAYVKEEDVESYKEQAKEAFTTDVYEYLRDEYGMEWDIPLGVGIVVGQHWGCGKEEIFDDATTWEYKNG